VAVEDELGTLALTSWALAQTSWGPWPRLAGDRTALAEPSQQGARVRGDQRTSEEGARLAGRKRQRSSKEGA